MEDREIREHEKQCISNCIHQFWNLPEGVEIENRDREYEKCLTECEVCS